MPVKIKEVRNYVESRYGIDASKLSDKDVTKLAVFFLDVVMSREMPVLTRVEREELGLLED